MGNGFALCGICMAFQNTGTRVFGAEVILGAGDFCDGDLSHSQTRRDDCHGTQGLVNMSAAALSWSIFTAPKLLSAVHYIDQKSTQLAQAKLVEQLRINAGTYDAGPLALGLYSEDFRQFLEKETANGRQLNVGIIVRSDMPHCGDGRQTRSSKPPEDDLTRCLRIMYW